MSRTKQKKSSHTFLWLKIVSVVLVPFLALWILPGLDEYRPSNAGSTGLTLTSVDIKDDYLKVQFSTTMNTDNYLYFKEIGSTNFISGRDMGDQGGVHRFDTDPNNNTLIPGTEYEFYIRSEETGNTTNFDEIGSSSSPYTIFTVGSVANTFSQFNHSTTTPSITGIPSTIEALFPEDITIADANQITLNETSPTFGNITISTVVINNNTVEITPSSALNIGSTYQVTYIATQNALEYANTISGIQPSVETPGLIFNVLTGTPDIDVQNDASGTLATVTHNTTANEIPFTVVTVGDTAPTQTIRVLNTNGTAALTPTLSFPASNTCVVGLQLGSSLDASIAVGQHDEFILELDTILADSFDNSECSLSINSNASPSPYTIFFSGTVNATSTLNVVGIPEIRLNDTEFEIVFETNIATDVELYFKTANGTFAGTAADTSNNQTTHTLGTTNLTAGIDYEYYIDIVENGNASNTTSIAAAVTPNTVTTFDHPFTPADSDINISQTLGSITIDFGEEIENIGGGTITNFTTVVELTDASNTVLSPPISIDGNNEIITLDTSGITFIAGDNYTISILEDGSGNPTIQTLSSGSDVGILETSSTFEIESQPTNLTFSNQKIAVDFNNIYMHIFTNIDAITTLYYKENGTNNYTSINQINPNVNNGLTHHRFEINNLDANTIYDFYIDGTDNATQTITNNFYSNGSPYQVSTLDPTIFNPEDNSIGHSITDNPFTDFGSSLSQQYQSSTIADILYLEESISGNTVSFNGLIQGNETIWNQNNNFAYNTIYEYGIYTDQVRLSNGIMIAGIEAKFTTQDYPTPIATFSPTSGSQNILTNTQLVITLNTAIQDLQGNIIDNSNVSNLITLEEVSSGNSISFTTNQNNNTYTITPDSNLSNGTYYKLLFSGNIENLSGVQATQTNGFVSYFTTEYAPGSFGFTNLSVAIGLDGIYPSINTAVPINLTLHYKESSQATYTDISIQTNQTNSFGRLYHHPYDITGLTQNTSYDLYFSGSENGNTSNTGNYYSAINPYQISTLATTIFTPIDTSTGILIAPTVEVDFGQNISTTSSNATRTFFVDSASTTINYTPTIQTNKISYAPSGNLNYISQYTYGVNSNTIQLANNIKVAYIESSFTTENNPGTPTVAITPTGTNVPVTDNITLTFSEPVRQSNGSVLTGTTVDSLVVLKKTNSSGAAVPFDATINSTKNIITINPTVSLEPNTTYYVEVPNNFENNSNIAVPITTSTFKTAPANTTINISILEEDADDDKIIIDYSTDISTTATVIYSRNSNFSNSSTETVTSRGLINGKYQYRFVLDNLLDDTRYYYQITATDGTETDVYTSNEKTDDDDNGNSNDEDDVYITEIMYNPDNSDEPEWIEIYNDTGDDTDFKNWYIEIDGTRYTFVKSYEIDDDELKELSGTNAFEVDDGEYFVLAYDTQDFENEYDNDFEDYDNEYDDTKVFELSQSLDISNSGEEIELYNDDDDKIDEVDFEDDWGNEDKEDDGDGYSLEKIDKDGSDTDSNWDTSPEKGGTPGRDNDIDDDSSSSGDLTITFSNIRADADNNDFRVKFNTSTSSSTRIYYGTTESVTQSVSGSSTGTSHDVVVSGLTKNTTYYYQLYASKNGKTKRSAIFNITTSDSSTDTGIDLQNIDVTSITKNSARVIFKTDATTDATISYSKKRSDVGYTNKPQWIASLLSIPEAIAQAVQTATSDNKTNHSVSLTQLEPYTTYYYQIEAKYGTKLAKSSVLSFRTENGTGGSSSNSSSFSRSSSSSISRSSSSSSISTGAQAIIRDLPKLVSRRVAFDATPSRNIPNGSKFEWDFDASNGTTQVDSTGRITHHTYPKDGNYTVTLTVKDTSGRILDTETTTAPVKSGQAASTTRLPQTGYASYAVIIALIAGVFYFQKYWIHKLRKKKKK